MSETSPNRSDKAIDRLVVPLSGVENVLGLTAATAHERYSRLTARELQVANMIAAGKSSREIAAELNIVIKTIDIHRAHIKIKLHASSVVEVANLVNLVRLANVSASSAASKP